MSGPIRAVGVLIPARNERPRVGPCLDAVFTALDRLPDDVATTVCLVVDRSRDGTAPAARAAIERWADAHGTRPSVDVRTNELPVAIGTLRNQAASGALERLHAVPPSAIWLLSTDADSRVPADWAVRHLQLADAGAGAVSGGVTPDGPVPPSVVDPDGVYAANLGVRADLFLQIGGFSEVRSGEDHDLLRRLRAAGGHVVAAAGIAVHTSVRLHGRARGGLADLLRAQRRRARPAPGMAAEQDASSAGG